MEVICNNKSIELQKKDRKVGGEAPAVKVKMLNGEDKVIGMLADKVQVMITLPYSHSLNDEVYNVVNKHKEKANIYLITSDIFALDVDEDFSSTDFKNFSMKFGVYMDESICAKSVFIIDKEGEIVYKDVLADVKDEFDVSVLDEQIQKAIEFKKKGHTHENWMGA
jgi:thiol peroxidase